MKKSCLLFFVAFLWISNCSAQVICSRYYTEVLFGPNNVILHNTDVSRYYINELDIAIDSLTHIKRGTEINAGDKVRLKKDIKAIKSIRKDWSRWSRNTHLSIASDSIVEVKEFFNRVVVDHPHAFSSRGGHGVNSNCMHSNPNDCLLYSHIESLKITIEDDFENEFIPNFHQFFNIVFD